MSDHDQSKAIILAPDDGILYKRNNEMRVKIRSRDTGGVYEICEERCGPGFQSRRNMHTKDYETFIVLEGSATFEVGNETIEGTPGMFIHIPPGVPHKVSTKDGIKMLLVFGPGVRA